MKRFEALEAPGVGTVVLLVHGVGDHFSEEMAASLQAAFSEKTGFPAPTASLEIGEFPQLEGEPGPERGLELRLSNEKVLFFPLVWGRTRPRVASFLKLKHGNWLVNIPGALFAAGIVNSNVAFAVGRPGRWAWRLGLFCFALVYTLGMLAFLKLLAHTIGALWAFAAMDWVKGLLAMVAWMVVFWGMAFWGSVVDIVGDVARYAAFRVEREILIGNLSEIIRRMGRTLPDRRIIVAGHSLGSVLASQAVARLGENDFSRNQILLVTLGCPLRFMACVFDKDIENPNELAGAMAKKGRVAAWMNFWRDGDFIGRSLGVSQSGFFFEKTLGDGPHWNMWSDLNLWGAIKKFIDGAASRRGVDGGDWALSGISTKEAAESRRLWNRIKAVEKIFIFGFLAFAAEVNLRFWRAEMGVPLLVFVSSLVLGVYLGVGAGMAMYGKYQFLMPISDREKLGAMRLWNFVCLSLLAGGVFLAFLTYVLRFLLG
ncbi:MAG: hypothetical protein ACE5JS_17085 [Nitrospinota bacterium]